ncbi:MAG: NADH-quinone oxidoreductase subunit B family protein [Desulfobacterales bacterium]
MTKNRIHRQIRRMISKIVTHTRKKSPWLLHFDCGSCNGCDIEVLACLTPVYDIERFGIINVGNPLHADILLVTGTVNRRNQEVLKNLYEQMPFPKVVVAIGACGLSGGIFRDAYNVIGGIDKVIPVDVYVPGCPAKPEAIIDRVVMALEKFNTISERRLNPTHGSSGDVRHD